MSARTEEIRKIKEGFYKTNTNTKKEEAAASSNIASADDVSSRVQEIRSIKNNFYKSNIQQPAARVNTPNRDSGIRNSYAARNRLAQAIKDQYSIDDPNSTEGKLKNAEIQALKSAVDIDKKGRKLEQNTQRVQEVQQQEQRISQQLAKLETTRQGLEKLMADYQATGSDVTYQAYMIAYADYNKQLEAYEKEYDAYQKNAKAYDDYNVSRLEYEKAYAGYEENYGKFETEREKYLEEHPGINYMDSSVEEIEQRISDLRMGNWQIDAAWDRGAVSDEAYKAYTEKSYAEIKALSDLSKEKKAIAAQTPDGVWGSSAMEFMDRIDLAWHAGITLAHAGNDQLLHKIDQTLYYTAGSFLKMLGAVTGSEKTKEKANSLLEASRKPSISVASAMESREELMAEALYGAGAVDGWIIKQMESIGSMMFDIWLTGGAQQLAGNVMTSGMPKLGMEKQLGGGYALTTTAGAMKPAISTTKTMAIRAAGSGMIEAEEKGYSLSEQILYGIASGSLEYLSETMFGGNPIYDEGSGWLTDAMAKTFKNPKVMKLMYSKGFDILSEGFEEVFVSIAQPIAESAITWEKPQMPTAQELAESFAGGLFLSVIGQGASVVATEVSGAGHKNRKAYRSVGDIMQSADAVELLIEEGLAADQRTDAYNLATKLQKKLADGKKLTASEVGKLVYANQDAIDRGLLVDADMGDNEAAPEGALHDAEDGFYAIRTVQTEGEKTGYQIVQVHEDGSVQPVGEQTDDLLTAKLMAEQQGLEIRDIGTEENLQQKAEAMEQETVLNELAQTERFEEETLQQEVQPVEAAQPAEDANETTGLTWAGDENQKEVIANEQIVSDGRQGRVPGESTGRETGGLSERRSHSTADQSRRADERKNLAKHLRLEKVSSLALLKEGTEQPSVRILPEEHWDDELRATAELVERETGKLPIFVVGSIPIQRKGTISNVRGAWSESRIIIQANHLLVSAEQIAKHEIYHDKAFQNLGLNREIKEKIIEQYSEEEFDTVLTAYIQKLRGVINVPDDPSAPGYKKALNDIYEEIFADAYAGINAFGAHAEKYQETVLQTVDQRANRKNHTVDTERNNGPPEQRLSWAGEEKTTDRTEGGKFSYAGEQAVTANLERLRQARELQRQGADNETIRKETGWFRGMDGKWRFEIDDSQMQYRKAGDAQFRQDHPEYVRHQELMEKMLNGVISETEAQELQDLHSIWGSEFGRLKERVDRNNATLGQVLEHPDLFAAYPQLKRVRVAFAELSAREKGFYRSASNEIVLSEKLKNAPEDDILHEIQHAIQKIEGFASGSSPEYWQRRIESGYDNRTHAELAHAENLQRQYDVMEAQDPEFMREAEELYASVPDMPRGEINGDTLEKIEDDPVEWQKFDARRDALEEKYGDKIFDFFVLKENMKSARTGERMSSDLYRDTAGEIEARDAAKRRNLTAQQRADTVPDYGNEDVVFADRAGDSFEYIGNTKDGRRCYRSGFDDSVSMDDRITEFKKRIATIFNLGAVELKTDVKKIKVRGDRFTLQKNLYGDDKGTKEEKNAKINALYDLADILSTAKYDPSATNIEDSYLNPENKPKNEAHKGVKYWYKFKNDIVFDGVPYTVTFNIRDKGSEQYEYLIDFKESKTPGLSNTAVNSLLRANQVSYEDNITLPTNEVNSRFSIDDDIAAQKETYEWHQKQWNADDLQKEIQRRSDKDFQRQLFEDGGLDALKDNESQIEKMQKRVDELRGTTEFQKLQKKKKLQKAKVEVEKILSEPDRARHKEVVDQHRQAVSKNRDAELADLWRQLELLDDPEYIAMRTRAGGTKAAREIEKERRRIETEIGIIEGTVKVDPKTKKPLKPVQESRPYESKKKLRNSLLSLFNVEEGKKAELGKLIDHYADRMLKNGELTQEDRNLLFDRLYDGGYMMLEPDEFYLDARNAVKKGRIYVSDQIKKEFGDDWNEFRKLAFSNQVYLVNDPSAPDVFAWNDELSETLPNLFYRENTEPREILETIVQIAEEGKGERVSLAEYTKILAGEEHISEDELLREMEKKVDNALITFANNAELEIRLRDQVGVKLANEREKFRQYTLNRQVQEEVRKAKEREDRKAMLQRQKENKELHELQQKTLKQLQWLSKNQHKAPEDLKKTFDEVLGDLDLYAVGAANEMKWSGKYQATWKDLAEMYKKAKETDPNFFPSEELKRIMDRLDKDKIADMDIDALRNLYMAAVGLRTEFYNRNNVINDELNRMFAEVYAEAKGEIQNAAGGYTGKWSDKLMNMEQLTPMNVLERMGGWNPNGTFYSMAKQLEKGERDIRDYTVKANKHLEEFLIEHADWVKKADGQGKDAIWYEIKVPPLVELRMGDQPIFGDPVTVYMTPSQKVHMYLESKNIENLRHMSGGRTFADKKLYSEGKRQEAFAQGRTIKLAPETVKNIVKDMTEEELELARLLENYYNGMAKQEINRVSNILYGYDKAQYKNYAPIYTNENYTQKEIGKFDATAEGVGRLKSRQNYSKNPSYNIGAFDAFERHVDQTGRFVGMAIPARNWNTLLNWQEKNNSMGDVIDHKWGTESKKYIEDLLNRLQGGKSKDSDSVSRFADKVLSNYISGVFGLNPSIVLKQLGSIPLASSYLGARNFPSPAQVGRIDRELIGKYTSELAWRTLGYTTPETKQLKENPNWTETNKFTRFTFGGGAITAMDGWAASTLWPWAENKVRRENPNLEVGTQEQINSGKSPFYQKVAETFNEAVSRSQSVSDEMHQSTLRKSDKLTTRALTMFKSDSAQGYNALRQKIGEARYYAKMGDKETAKTAKKAVGGTFLSLIGGYTWAELVSFLIALWKNKGKKYRDDEDELTFGSIAEEMTINMVSSLAGVVVGGEELTEVIGNVLTGERWYGIDTPGIAQITDIIELITEKATEGTEIIKGAVEIVNNDGDLMEYLRQHGNDILGSIKELAAAAATYIGGIPVNNLEAYLLGTVKWISPELATAYEDLLQTTGKSNLDGLEGDALESRIDTILDLRVGDTAEDTAAELAALYEAGYKNAVPTDTPSQITVNGEARKMDAYQQQTYERVWRENVEETLDELVSQEWYQAMDEEQRAKTVDKLYDYADQLAKAEVFDDYQMSSTAGKILAYEQAGMDVTEYLRMETGEDVNNIQRLRTVAEADLSEQEKVEAMGIILGTELQTESGARSQYKMLLDAIDDGYSFDEWLTLKEEGLMTDSQFGKIQITRQYNVTTEQYLEYKKQLKIADERNAEGAEGSYDAEEIEAAIEAVPGLSNEQRAALWQTAKKRKPDSYQKNPYHTWTGRQAQMDMDALYAEPEDTSLDWAGNN